jgi:plastocyanin
MLASPAMRRRLRAVTLLAATFVPTLPSTPAGATSDEGYRGVEVRDNVFAQRIVRVPVGATIEWTNEGRGTHNVTADDGAFVSSDLVPGESFEETFPTTGAFPYFCSIHGAPGVGMTGLVLVGDAPIPGAASDVGPGRETPPCQGTWSASRRTRRRSRPGSTRPSPAASSSSRPAFTRRRWS